MLSGRFRGNCLTIATRWSRGETDLKAENERWRRKPAPRPRDQGPKKAAPAKAAKPTKKAAAKPAAEPKDKKLSAIDAAAKVLGESGEPMNAKAMIEAMTAKKVLDEPGWQDALGDALFRDTF